MPDCMRFHYDAATVLTMGRRERQEDAVEMHFPAGAVLGACVLADGMGGHAAGNVASATVVEEVLGEIRGHVADPDRLEREVGAILHSALDRANARVARLAAASPDLQGMGSTLVAPILVKNRLYWISVGDSPLYLMRGARMARLNKEHSLAGRMEGMVARGLLSREEADNHPDRDCLTSVLFGRAIPEIDCREAPLTLKDGDILIAASDGLQFLDDLRIAEVVYANRRATSAEIGRLLLQEIGALDDPDQDNVSIGIIKISAAEDAVETAFRKPDTGCEEVNFVPPAGRVATRPLGLWQKV